MTAWESVLKFICACDPGFLDTVTPVPSEDIAEVERRFGIELPGGKWTAPTRAALAGATTAHVEERRDMQRRVGLTVPSCKSCQDTLFMARCDIEGRSCK